MLVNFGTKNGISTKLFQLYLNPDEKSGVIIQSGE
jgi:hypothetical protein